MEGQHVGQIADTDPRIVSLFAARPILSDAPNLYDSLEERQRIDRIIADIRKDERASARRWLGYAASVVLTIALIYFLIVSAMVLA